MNKCPRCKRAAELNWSVVFERWLCMTCYLHLLAHLEEAEAA